MSREWSRTTAKFYLLRSAIIVTRVITRGMQKAGLETEIETISRATSRKLRQNYRVIQEMTC